MNACFVSAVFFINSKSIGLFGNIDKVSDYLKNNFDSYEIIIVFDGSVNMHELIMTNTNLGCVINSIQLFGENATNEALAAGRDIATGDFVFEFDDISMDYDIEEIQNLLNYALKNGCDVVELQRQGITLMDIIRNALFRKVRRKYKYGFTPVRLVSRRAINRIEGLFSANIHRKLCYYSCGLPIDKIYYSAPPRHCEIEYSILTLMIYTPLFQVCYFCLCILLFFLLLLILGTNVMNTCVTIMMFAVLCGEFFLWVLRFIIKGAHVKSQYIFSEIHSCHR